jgi:putative acetyltransferase
MVIIRQERQEDIASIHQVNARAFSSIGEANLVDKLRSRHQIILSLVAIEEEQIVGHILFTPVALSGNEKEYMGVGIGPLAVLPKFQKQGIGTLLVQTGLEQCQKRGYEFVVVLGEPGYYSRFGFVSTSRYHIRCEYDVPVEAFMAIALQEGALTQRPGVVKYEPEFNDV